MKPVTRFLAGYLPLNLLVACSDSSTTNDESSVETGRFIDSEVSGLNYQTESRQGVTSAKGEFEYLPGEMVTFTIGDLTLPTVAGSTVITPLDIFATNNISNATASNLSR
jgi:hypothetical protein